MRTPNPAIAETCSKASWWSLLVSRKVACCEASTEGSETANSGTDEQKLHKRYVYTGK